MVADFTLLSFALWASFSLRFSTFYTPPNWQFGLILLAAPVIGVLTMFFFKIYKTVTRFIIFLDILQLYFAVTVSVLLWVIITFAFNDYGLLPRTVPLGYWAFSIFLVWAIRWFAAFLLKGQEHLINEDYVLTQKIAIYGAGVTGTQLAETLTRQNAFKICAFLDDNPALWKRRIAGYKIYPPAEIEKIIHNDGINEVILALPSASISDRKRVVAFLQPYPIAVRTLPAVEDIVSGRVSVGDIKLVGVEELLGREPVPPITSLFDRVILDKSILVTGAGGSIGSELSRQVLKAKPRTLLLFEISEAALYLIEQNLHEQQEILAKSHPDMAERYLSIKIVPLLGSVQDAKRIKTVLQDFGVQTIFHAAAYKHVPLVESNPMIGVLNNMHGTRVVAEMAQQCGVERFVLISTDKAVRPTNIMGATKRLAEMFLQAFSHQHNSPSDTIFTMVRFGNVLDSSGSVVQKFRKQIMAGGPVTVTDPEITRFFMSIPEAAELVIQACAMAKGGDVFVLDMGEPVKIMDMAISMIRLMGKQVKDEETPNGDIEITYLGLRPGEKLYEELLIEGTTEETSHPRILKNNEAFLKMDILSKSLDDIDKAIAQNNLNSLCQIMERIVTGYVASKEIKHDSTQAQIIKLHQSS